MRSSRNAWTVQAAGKVQTGTAGMLRSSTPPTTSAPGAPRKRQVSLSLVSRTKSLWLLLRYQCLAQDAADAHEATVIIARFLVGASRHAVLSAAGCSSPVSDWKTQAEAVSHVPGSAAAP